VRSGVIGDEITRSIVVAVVYFDAARDVLSPYGDTVDGKVDIKITNAAVKRVSDSAAAGGRTPVVTGTLGRTRHVEQAGFLNILLSATKSSPIPEFRI
jgi:predicted dinucleotide-binding enzyme